MKFGWPFTSGTQATGPHNAKAGVPLVALAEPGAAIWGGSDGAALARDGYLRNAIAYRCIRMVAEAAATIPFTTADPLLSRLLRRPQPGLSAISFLETVYVQLQIYGNAYLEGVKLEAGETGIAALYALPPDAMRPVLDPRGWVEAWAVRERQGERLIRRDAETGWTPVLHLKLFHPQNAHQGLAPLAAARRALDLHNASADWAKALIDNSAKPSGALIYAGHGRMPADQFDQLKSELDALYSGAANAGRPLLLEGGLDWRQMSLSPAEMDFQQARNAAAREIALALGVPPMLLGIPGDNTYANYREANLAFWRLTVLPLARKMAGELAIWLGEAFEIEAAIDCDLDRVPALSAERDALWARLEAASFATEDEKRALAGLGQ